MSEEFWKFKFLNNPDETTRIRQTIEEIRESFISDELGFIETEQHTFFFKGSPISQMEDLCILCDIQELIHC